MTQLSSHPSPNSTESNEKYSLLLERLRDDPEWFFQGALKIVNKAGELVPFKVNQQQRLILNIVRAHRRLGLPIRLIILKCRQIGMSTLSEGLAFHHGIFWPNQNIRVIADRYETTDHLFDITRRFYREMPEDPLLKPRTESQEKKGFVFSPPHNSAIRVDTAGQQHAGTGQTIQFGHFSEVSKWPSASAVMTSLMQAIPRRDNTIVLLESTANGIGDYFHDVWSTAITKNGNVAEEILRRAHDVDDLTEYLSQCYIEGYIPLFFPWHEFPEYQEKLFPGEKERLAASLDDEEKRIKKEFGLTLEQIKYRRIKIDELAKEDGISPEDRFRQEYPLTPEEAFVSTGSTVFDKAALRNLKADKELGRYNVVGVDRPFKFNEMVANYTDHDGTFVPPFMTDPYGAFRVWERPTVNEKTSRKEEYMIAVDIAMGSEGNDYTVVEVFNKKTLNQAAEWHGYVEPTVAARIAAIIGAWYHTAMIAIENNNQGLAAVIELVSHVQYENAYVRGGGYKSVRESPMSEWGWKTDQQTKPMIIGLMARHIREKTVKLHSPGLVEECRQYRIDESGKYSAPKDKHDDRVMATAICLQAIYEYPYVPEVTERLQEILDQRELEEVIELEPDNLEEI